jgi:hypothetical protein
LCGACARTLVAMPPPKGPQPPKWTPVQGELVACDAELRRLHLRAFAESFIQPHRVERWIHATIDKPTKARTCLAKFPDHRIASHCPEVSGTALWPESLTARFGDGLGLFFNGRGDGGLTSIAHAATLGGDAIFSLVPGKLAVVFFHEGWGWICTR